MFIRIIALLCVLVATSCGGATVEQVAVTGAVATANHTRLAVQAAEAGALALYRTEQFAELERVKAQGGSREQAIAAVTVVREKWRPVWAAIDAAVAAHRALVEALTAYGDGQLDVAAVSRTVTALAEAEQAVVAALALAKGDR